MPCAAVHPNGTLFAVCGNGLAITSVTGDPTAAPWQARWNPQRPLLPDHKRPSSEQGAWEDPDLWWDKRGHWHILFHVYPQGGATASTGLLRYSGHGWSRDGISWQFTSNSSQQPFNGTVDFVDGTSTTYSTRERPHLIFADDSNRTTPVGVITAVSSQPVGTSCDTCAEKKCNACKITPGLQNLGAENEF